MRTEAIRRLKSASGAKILQTRLIMAAVVLLLASSTTVFKDSVQISWTILAYVALTVLFALLSSTWLDQKRIRLIPELLDVLAISVLVDSTGGSESSWFVLYLFPVMSAARFLGPAWSVTLAVIATISYAFATYVPEGMTTPAIYSFCLRAATLNGVALTAANLARTRDRAEAILVKALEKIDREILTNATIERVMDSILAAAMDITDSDLSAIVLVDGDKSITTFTAARTFLRTAPSRSEWDESEAGRLIQKHYLHVVTSRRPLSLPERRPLATTMTVLGSPDRADRWPARLVPLEIEGAPFGVLGVFSCRRLHYYTPNDLRKLSGMAHLVAMAQKNARLYRELVSREQESKERLQVLYEIGGQLKAEQGLDQLFRNVVALVSARLASEEAALFLSDDPGTRLEKVAVSGPDDEISMKLATIEHFYDRNESLTGKVFDSKSPCLLNYIPPEVDYVTPYSEALPSGRTSHYMGVPLLIGDEVLGVIRVLNKKAEDYAPQGGAAKLAEGGFSSDDLNLLTMIATQIASAIRNAKLIERNRYFRNLVYNSPGPIIVLDKTGRIQNFNRECEKIWGFSEQEILGKPIADYYESAAHAREIGRALWEAKDHMIHDYNARIRSANGEIIPIRLSATLFVDKDGVKAGSIGVFKDARLEGDKIRAEKLAALGRLAQTTGHDIKHDIGTILNYLDPLEQSLLEDPEMLQACSAIRTATTEAISKLQNMLMTAAPSSPVKKVVSIRSELVAFEANIKHRMSVTNVEFKSKFPDCDLLMLADVKQLRQVFANLLDNSLDAIRSARRGKEPRLAGKIELTVEVGKNLLLLSWHDDGCGMSEETRRYAFTPFFTTKKTGNGLGLFIAKTVIEGHDGQIAVQPSDGVGACFQIKIPLLQDLDYQEHLPR